MKQDERLEKATEKLVDLIEGHFASLPATEREERWRKLHEAAAKAGRRAKSAEPPKTPANRRVLRRHA